MLQNTHISFIGSGAMGEAIIKGLLDKNMVAPSQITASDPVESRRTYLNDSYSVQTTADNIEAVQRATVVVLSIKPQILALIGPELRGKIAKDALVLSIMAGSLIETISELLDHKRIVRTMPNTPAQVGMGASVWTATAEVSAAQKAEAEIILEALGVQIFAPNEHYLDMATGLSGSGPGYVFLFAEAMIDAGVQMGFSRVDAEKLSIQTIAGSIELMRQSGEHPAVLRNRVTSPGGTTAAGLHALEKGGLRALMSDAIHAAYHRSEELGTQ